MDHQHCPGRTHNGRCSKQSRGRCSSRLPADTEAASDPIIENRPELIKSDAETLTVEKKEEPRPSDDATGSPATPSPEELRDTDIKEAEARRRADEEHARREAEAKLAAEEEERRKQEEAGRENAEAKAADTIAKAQPTIAVTTDAAAGEAERLAEDERSRQDAEVKQHEDEQERGIQSEVDALRRAEEERGGQEADAKVQPSRRPLVVTGALGVVLISAVGVWVFTTPPTPIQPSPSPVQAPPVQAPTPPVRPAVQPASSGGVPLSPEQERALKPKDAFKECATCPEMVVVPAGSFTMGSPSSEPKRYPNESPQHAVRFARQLAVGRFALTFDEWDGCVADGGCNGYKPNDGAWGRGRRPAINVSWDDAKTYLAWLSRKTGKPYRLLSEAEFEYAARAGSTTAYPWGNDIGKGNANCDGCGSQWDNRETSPVGSFKPNAFGLYDMAGNVWQLVQDCYQDNYNGASTDGSANTSGGCVNRVGRAGSWNSNPQFLRAADRSRNTTDDRDGSIGFRVGRTLAP